MAGVYISSKFSIACGRKCYYGVIILLWRALKTKFWPEQCPGRFSGIIGRDPSVSKCTMGRKISHANPVSVTFATQGKASMVQQDVAIVVGAWEDTYPAIFLVASLVLQLVLLITGELRKHTSKVRLYAWLAYVGADILATFLLGLLSRKTLHCGIFGLWSALLIYHLGGPDNFTAYERADSELWLRHLLYLALQVVTAGYVIAINTRGFFLIPTLLVFVVGVLRDWERNHALKKSSRKGIAQEVSSIYEYMMSQQRPMIHHDGSPPHNGSSDHDEYLQYIVAGGKEWYEATRAGKELPSWYETIIGQKESPSWSADKRARNELAALRNLVTTADIFKVVRAKFSRSEYVRACQLSVAFASSFAYLRRVITLSRLEQVHESSQSKMRKLWFLNEDFIKKQDWVDYIRIEGDFLYNWLYAKSTNPSTYLSQLILRVLCSMALFGALVLIITSPSYVRNADEIIWGAHAYNTSLNKDATCIVLAMGFVVETAYLLRLLASKRAVVAMLAAVVRTERQRSQGSLRDLQASFVLRMCKLSLWSNTFFEKKFSTSKGTYLPRSNFLCRLCSKSDWLKNKLYIFQIGWDQMICTVSLNESDFKTQLEGIQAQETPALDIVLQLVESYANYDVWSEHFSHKKIGITTPLHIRDNLDIFVAYYKGDWETVLLRWWIGTLKVLILEMSHNYVQVANGLGEDEMGEVQIISNGNISEEISTFDEKEMGAIQIISNGHISEEKSTFDAKEMGEIQIISNGNISEEKSTFDEKECVHPSDSGCDELRNQALWLMAYICRLLTVCPDLLPTHLELTKMRVAAELRLAHTQITKDTKWVEVTRCRVESLQIPALKPGEHRSEDIIKQCIADMTEKGFAHSDHAADVATYSSELAILLVDCMSMKDRWALIRDSAAHFIACLANVGKTVEHCAKLTQGGELLTILWILSSELGGGAT